MNLKFVNGFVDMFLFFVRERKASNPMIREMEIGVLDFLEGLLPLL